MGSPLSSFLAEAVIRKRSVTNNNDIKTWNRYVDDVQYRHLMSDGVWWYMMVEVCQMVVRWLSDGV
jgi:hypothetical protein